MLFLNYLTGFTPTYMNTFTSYNPKYAHTIVTSFSSTEEVDYSYTTKRNDKGQFLDTNTDVIEIHEPRFAMVNPLLFGTVPSLKSLAYQEVVDMDLYDLSDLVMEEPEHILFPFRGKRMFKFLHNIEYGCCYWTKEISLFHPASKDKILVYKPKLKHGKLRYHFRQLITENEPWFQYQCNTCYKFWSVDICFMRGYDKVFISQHMLSRDYIHVWLRTRFFKYICVPPTTSVDDFFIWQRAMKFLGKYLKSHNNTGYGRTALEFMTERWFGRAYTERDLRFLLILSGIEQNPGPSILSGDELHGYTEVITTLCNDEAGDLVTSFVALFEKAIDKIPLIARHTLRVILNMFILSNTEDYPLLCANITNLVLESNGHLVLDTTMALTLGKCISLTYKYIRTEIYKEKSPTTFEEELHNFEMTKTNIGGLIAAMGACLASLIVIGKLPQAKDLDKFLSRCHSVPRAFKSVNEIFSFFDLTFRNYLADGSLPFLSKIGTQQIDKDMDNFVEEIGTLLQDMHGDESMLDTRLCRKAKDLYETQLTLIKTATDTRNEDVLKKLRTYTPILHNIYNRAIKAPGSGVQFRQEPAAAVIFGEPGIGKSRLAQVIAMHCYQACGVTKEELSKHHPTSFIFSKLVGQRYWTNYNSTQHAVTILDDANQVQLKYVDGAPFPSIFINLKNSVACPLEVAECDLKKLAYFNSRLILVTDNISAAPAQDVLTSAEAYERRFDFRIHCKKTDEPKDMTTFTHLRFDVEIRNLKKDMFEKLDDLTFEQLVPYIIKRIGHYKELYESNASNDQSILDSYYNEEVHMDRIPRGFSSFSGTRVVHRQVASLNEGVYMMLSLMPWYTRFYLLTYFYWQRYILRRSGVDSFRNLACLITRTSFLCWIRRTFRDAWYREKKILVGTFLYLVGAVICVLKLYFLIKAKTREEVHSYSNTAKVKRAAKVKLSQRTLKDKPHSLKTSPPVLPILEDYGVEVERACRPICMTDTNLDEMLLKISKNVYLITLQTNDYIHRNHLTILKARIAVTNWHFIERVRDALDNNEIVKFTMKRPVERTFIEYNLDPEVFVKTARVWTTQEDFIDAALICLGVKVPCHRDISKYLMPTQNLMNLSSGYMKRLSIHPVREVEVVNTGALLYRYDPKLSYPWNDEENDCSVRPKNLIYYQSDSTPGVCGSPVMVVDSSQACKMVGFAMSYNASLGASVACHLPPEVIEMYTEELKNILTDYDYALNNISTEDVPHSSTTLLVMKDQPYFEVGQYEHTAVIQTVSALSPSICFDHITKHITKPARLRNFTANGEEVDVLRKAISKNLNTSCKISKEHLEVIQDHIDYLYNKIVDGEKPFVLSWEQVIKGGIPGLQPIPRSTSPGAPYIFQSRKVPGKQQFLGSDDRYILDDPFLMSQLKNFSDKCKQNLRSIEPYTVQLKDETRDFERVAAGKTRSFMACNLTLTCKIREYFGFFFAKTHLNGKTCGLLPGFNPNGDDANFVFRYITEMALPSEPRFGAGDFSNFDGTLNEEILNLILKKWILSLDLNTEQQTEAIVCGLNIINAIYLLSNNLYMNTHSLPSGCPATTILNSWYNSTICAVTMYEAVKKRGLNVPRFRDYYRLLVYGDDNLFALAPPLCDDDISNDITKTMSSLGMTYTSGTKKGEILFTSLWENEILKRTFKFNNDLARYTMPLRLSVILETLNWDRKKHQRDKIEQFLQNVEFVVRELCLHGPETFNKYYARIKDFANSRSIELPFYNYKLALKLLDTEY